MSRARSQNFSTFRLLVGVVGVALLAYLVFRVGPGMLLQHALKVGWGMLLILFLGGVSHLIKTWAWRLTFRTEFRKQIPLWRGFRLRRASLQSRRCDQAAIRAARRAAILVISHDARERLLVAPDAADFDGLADAEVAVYQDRGAVMTDVNGLTFPQEIFPAIHEDGNAKAQIQKDSFTAAKIFLQDRRGLTPFGNAKSRPVSAPRVTSR